MRSKEFVYNTGVFEMRSIDQCLRCFNAQPDSGNREKNVRKKNVRNYEKTHSTGIRRRHTAQHVQLINHEATNVTLAK